MFTTHGEEHQPTPVQVTQQPDQTGLVGTDGEEGRSRALAEQGQLQGAGLGEVVRIQPALQLNPVNAVIGRESYATQPNRGKSTFGTKELWGVACTGPWLHDGRATTLSEAILLHGGEAAGSRDRFKGLPAKDQKDVIAFLGNQVLYLNTADPGKTPDGLSSDCEVKN